MIRVIRYGPETIDEREDVSVDELPDLLGEFPVTWVDITGLGDAETIQEVGELFELHRLALEDVVHVHQRAKLDAYDEHVFIVARMVEKRHRFRTEQLSLFLGNDFVLTWQERPGDCFDPIRNRLQTANSPSRRSEADYLAYVILDAVIDAYFPVLEDYGRRIDHLEREVTKSVRAATMHRIHHVRSDVRAIERAAWPHRELMRRLMDDKNNLVSDHTRTHLRDVYDHTLQILELLQSYRDLCSDLRDYYFSAVNIRMNEIMKVLTIVSTIFIPLSFIAGVYGMNFDADASPWNMPELKWAFGYPTALAVMAASAGAMLYLFRRSGWIGNSEAAAHREHD